MNDDDDYEHNDDMDNDFDNDDEMIDNDAEPQEDDEGGERIDIIDVRLLFLLLAFFLASYIYIL